MSSCSGCFSPLSTLKTDRFCAFVLSIFFLPGGIHHIVIFFIQVGVIDSPPRAFNSPYSSALSLEYAPINRMSEFKV